MEIITFLTKKSEYLNTSGKPNLHSYMEPVYKTMETRIEDQCNLIIRFALKSCFGAFLETPGRQVVRLSICFITGNLIKKLSLIMNKHP